MEKAINMIGNTSTKECYKMFFIKFEIPKTNKLVLNFTE